MMGATGLLNMLPGIGMLNPQQLLNTAMLAGGLANLLTQFPQFLSQAITGLFGGSAQIMADKGILNPPRFDPGENDAPAELGLGGGEEGLPRVAETLPPITIGVNHSDPTSNRVMRDSLKNAYRVGYRTYGVELPVEYQAGLDAFRSTYGETGNLQQAKDSFWEAQLKYFHNNPTKYRNDWSPDLVRSMDVYGLRSSDENGYLDNMLGRVAVAHDLGMNVRAIDAPHVVWQNSIDSLVPIQQQATAAGGWTPSLSPNLQNLANQRNPHIASNLQPGMVAELGAWHVSGGSQSVGAISGGRGLPVISFMAFSGSNATVPMPPTHGGAPNFNRAPSVGGLVEAIGRTGPLP
jgi:hypothetical protein